jgi:hypothetical protein
MEGIKARILIRTEMDGEIAHIYSIDALRSLFPNRGLKLADEKLLAAFDIEPKNSEIVIKGKSYLVLYVSTKFLNVTYPSSKNTDINLYCMGKPYPYNFEITYFVVPA